MATMTGLRGWALDGARARAAGGAGDGGAQRGPHEPTGVGVIGSRLGGIGAECAIDIALPSIPIKVEESADLPPVSALTGGYDHRHVKSSSSSLPVFRFGADISSSSSPTSPSSFTFMSHGSWPSSSSTSTSFPHHQSGYAVADRYPIPSSASPVNGQNHTHPLNLVDDYEDEAGDDLGDLPSAGLGGMGMSAYGGAGGKGQEKQIRRRSSKACDQCRKSKCKCERSSPQDPCRNCVMLNTPCTFLGPSRKRGPPKGYIDAIEARLHQTEALIGILLSSKDSRARSVLEDLSEDPLAKEIISRVDNSPYGYKGRSRGAEAPSSRSRPPPDQRDDDRNTVHATHPSNEWQDQVIKRLNAAAASRNALLPEGQVVSGVDEGDDDDDGSPSGSPAEARPASAPRSQASTSDARRQRRRLDDAEHDDPNRSHSSASSRSPIRRTVPAEEESMEDSDESGEDEMAIALGQLSLNEDEQVRFHGKMSGLHLLGVKERQDGRGEGGIWRFPKARVWPPLPSTIQSRRRPQSDEFVSPLPDLAKQELLLDLYFKYVHPLLPIVHKQSFLEDFRNGNLSTDSPYSGESSYSDAASPLSSGAPGCRRRVPTLLLLTMFALAARFSAQAADVPPPDDGSMWTAGDAYMEDAKIILDRTYAASRPSTCQSLLLLGFREIGIGAMAQAWLYIGMAVRMAQDLGLHKSADQWTNGHGELFSSAELQERRRIWYGCVIMDKYVCTYIGRPVAIYERDFDTCLPDIEEGEEMELWAPHVSPQVLDGPNDVLQREVAPVPGRILSCFIESAKLSVILSEICQSIYAIKPAASRPAELARLDSQLTKWSLELPEHLRFDPASPRNPPPPPNIFTLHMQYWCTVLLLRRPFIRHIEDSKALSPSATSAKEAEVRANSRKHYDMCVQAANHITSIVTIYCEYRCPKRAPVFLCYYVFTAAIMHVASLRTYPDDPQASRGLDKCMEILQRMSIIWPSAYRALELLTGAKSQLTSTPWLRSVASEPRLKRRAEDDAGDLEGAVTPGPGRSLSQEAYRAQTSYIVPSQPQPQQQAHPQPHQQQQSGFSSLSMDLQGGSNYMQASISTSVLPPQYSTGLVDERGMGGALDRAGAGGDGRNPRYWNDYSALPQMETTYGMPVLGDSAGLVHGHGHGAHGHGHQPAHGHHGSAQNHGMYVSDQYSMFGSMPPSSQ
ncbi:fungal-specific transcription factor domain-containing protein [Epithele typhae]|uniref:fungal-specific transcription factor domain-containing protein n=1 Tax=Epithele typhae TaxID=378194 RepID=UPI00200851A3|nr:fungal-specific transcription factor domain-containing protein [Epithele typhae]KAH9937840.1 fungal-specific transcription factor domain-containing protein [Epithele typhae]